MYEHVFHYFGLRENPFHISPDPRFFHSTRAHASALANLQMGVDTRQGFIVVSGEAGTGKTILLHHFLDWLKSRQQSSCYIFQCQLKAFELFESVLQDFGVPCDSRRKGDQVAALKQWLVRRHALSDSPVLVIDEAQAISIRTLDRLRMLLNLETPAGKLLQVVLAGQPELEEKLRRPELRQLHQRIVFRCVLGALSMEETAEYVDARLAACGAKDTKLFPDESVEAVHIYSEGIPRVVNLLCEHAMLRAFGEKQCMITPDTIRRVATTFEFGPLAVSESEHEGRSRSARPVSRRAKESSARPVQAFVAPAARTREGTEGNSTSPPTVETQEIKPRSKANSDPAREKAETQVLVARAAAGTSRTATVKLRTARSPIIALVVQEEPQLAMSKQVMSAELPVNWKRPGMSDRVLAYWRGVERSFVRDFRQFLEIHAITKKVGPSSHRA
jgi:general secretion pathway protein A